VEKATTEAMEQLRSNVEAEMEALRQILATEGDEVMTRLNWARSKLRQQLDALDDVTARCLDVNTMKCSISITQNIPWTGGFRCRVFCETKDCFHNFFVPQKICCVSSVISVFKRFTCRFFSDFLTGVKYQVNLFVRAISIQHIIVFLLTRLSHRPTVDARINALIHACEVIWIVLLLCITLFPIDYRYLNYCCLCDNQYVRSL